MTEEANDIKKWEHLTSNIKEPGIVWKNKKNIALFCSSIVFFTLIFFTPENIADFTKHSPFELDNIIEEIDEKITVLEEEDIIEHAESEDLTNNLKKIYEKSSGEDPAKTWEALDHISETLSNEALTSAEESLTQIDKLAKMEALSEFADKLLNSDGSIQKDIMDEYANILKAQNLEKLLMKNGLSKDILNNCKNNALTPDQLKQLKKMFGKCKNNLSSTIKKLEYAKLIDAAMSEKCKKAGQLNITELSEFLDKTSNLTAALELFDYIQYGKGGVNRGPGHAPMTWTNGTKEENINFKEQSLSSDDIQSIKDNQLVALKAYAPEESEEDNTVLSGKLTNVNAGEGSAIDHPILPKHKDAIKNFFRKTD